MRSLGIDKLGIIFDGSISSKEIVWIALSVIVLTILMFLLIMIITNVLRKIKRRRNSIFSRRKNRYKSRIGRKNKH